MPHCIMIVRKIGDHVKDHPKLSTDDSEMSKVEVQISGFVASNFEYHCQMSFKKDLSTIPNTTKNLCGQSTTQWPAVRTHLLDKTVPPQAPDRLIVPLPTNFLGNHAESQWALAIVGCLESWTKNNWRLTNFSKTPMGPKPSNNAHLQFSEFEQYENLQDIYDYVDINFNTDIKLSFSENTKFVIRKCVKRVPIPGKYPKEDSNYDKALDSIQTRKGIAYAHIIIIRCILEAPQQYCIDFISMTFCIYDCREYSLDKSRYLPIIEQYNDMRTIVQLLRNYTNDKVLVMVTAKTRVYDLPMWQSVKISKNISAANYSSYNKIIIQLIPKLNEHSLNPLWAIANVRQCPQNGANLDLKLPTPNNYIIKKSTTEPIITIPDLHPYTYYSAQVHNSRHFSAKQFLIQRNLSVETTRLELVIAYPPEDCTTISGSLTARIKIHDISDAVQYFNVTKRTKNYNLNLNQLYQKLNGVERYITKAKRSNASAYQTYEFETPPTAPPKITNVEVVEIDTRQTPATIHLRWQSPRPPLNGKLRDLYYRVIEVQINESCDLWDDYICKIVQKSLTFPEIIKVLAHNMNVTQPGLPVFVTDDMFYNTMPDDLGLGLQSSTITAWSSEVLSYTDTRNLFKPEKAHFPIAYINKTLEYPVTQYMRNYTKRLYLFPSTQYVVYIQAVTIANKSSSTKFVKIDTPSIAVFDGVLDVMVNKSDSTILLNIPSVLNDTQDSMMHIIVKGSNLCKQYSEVPENLQKRAGVKIDEIAWQAAEVSTRKLAGERFSIGDNRIYGNIATNCLLKHEGFYEIAIIPIMLAKSIRIGEVAPKNHEAWIVLIILFLVVTNATSYLYQRKKQKFSVELMQNEIALSQSIKNYEQETKCVISNSTQNQLTSSDRQ
ncbi:Receptor-type tyrosine-protein phosphatase mu [Temnothorax longispinosus]|uniref:Receptor-type tyrosine-protein phosphatase mu n=1 Tax=Temnothorax longispinosus TaxID=300112 RepID=A0A4S2JKH0_9HYME|nr:Receptor-type tyrosine-protein phosphatase mu [Temnothorax longispinosus]